MPPHAWALALPWRGLVKLGLLVLLVVAANLVAGWITELLKLDIRPSNEDWVHWLILTSAAVYALLMAVPFVPGIEIGLALIGILGPPIVFLVYLSTVGGLTLAFAAGRLISLRGLIRFLSDLRLHRASRLLATIEPMSRDERLAFLVAKTPHRVVPFLLRHRYLALAVLFNMPGNFLVGGGGGIALVAGVSRLYSALGFLTTVAVAVSPVPLAILLFGRDILGS